MLTLSKDINRAGGILISDDEKNDLISIVNEMNDEIDRTSKKHSSASSDLTAFKTKRTHLGTAGAPKLDISKDQLVFLAKYKFTVPFMAETLQTSESTIRRRLRWNIVIHGGIDGYSRLVTFLHASNNNQSTTVSDLFIEANTQHGVPSRIRVDHGGENVDICTFMEGYRGTNRGSAIKGKSAHNQRIERLWADLWESVSNEYYDLFTYMEDIYMLDVTCARQLWAFQYVFYQE
ncbi:unnamed protein product [Mytilus coruscus]|uniref:Integrase core domain-containing protein n=1 Tax=Mytilus coruscus TaxID=42192 RepID=A0A6J8DM88_MYTCO|nr:unnamed protein product [Mytilus coruscus]